MYCWLDGKTVVVTGASGGMGAGIAATLIKKHGCTVIGVARSEPKMLKFIEELGPTYAQQFSYKLFDVSVKENWENFYNELVEEGVQVDVLVNNAGILPKFKRFDRYSDEEIERAININFYSCVYSVKTFLPMLLKSTDPGIVNIDSSAALMSLAGTSMYSASKAALKGFTEALREEFRGKCYVGLVCPGFTKTDIFRGQSNAGGKGEKGHQYDLYRLRPDGEDDYVRYRAQAGTADPRCGCPRHERVWQAAAGERLSPVQRCDESGGH